MELRRKPVTRGDELDRDAFKSMIESPLFEYLQSRITAELRRAEDALVREPSIRELRKSQGAVMALRTALGLPAKILAELNKA